MDVAFCVNVQPEFGDLPGDDSQGASGEVCASTEAVQYEHPSGHGPGRHDRSRLGRAPGSGNNGGDGSAQGEKPGPRMQDVRKGMLRYQIAKNSNGLEAGAMQLRCSCLLHKQGL